jgi:hypothetical protein
MREKGNKRKISMDVSFENMFKNNYILLRDLAIC